MRYLLRKCSYAAATLFVVVSLTFVAMKLIPGDPFTEEKALPAATQQALRDHYGLNDRWDQQYFRYLISILKWDLGPSFYYHDRSVSEIIRESFPISALLGVQALAVAISVGVAFGTIAALNAYGWQDRAFFLFSIIIVSMPNFVLAALLQYFLGFKLALLPVARWGSFAHTLLPTLALAALPSVFIARLLRSSMMDVLQQDYVKTAQAKGIPNSTIIFRHIASNAFLPILPYLGQLAANILVGSFIVEKVFSIPGLGQWFVSSVSNRDYPMIMGLTLFYSILLLLMLLTVDLIYGWIDPRIRLKDRSDGVR